MIRRREFVSLGAAGVAACTRAHGDHFGNATPRAGRNLVYSLQAEPDTLDSGKPAFGVGILVIPASFEQLAQYDPKLPKPMTGLPADKDASRNQDRFTPYLRCYPTCRGTRSLDADRLHSEFTPLREPAGHSIRGRWYDVRQITADNFAYCWRHLLPDPSLLSTTDGVERLRRFVACERHLRRDALDTKWRPS